MEKELRTAKIENGKNENGTIEVESVSYYVFEAAMARWERTVKRMLIAFVIVILVAIFAPMWFVNQFEYAGETTETVTLDGQDGNANFVKGSGVISNGEDSLRKSSKADDEKKER